MFFVGEKMRIAFARHKLLTFSNKIYWCISDIEDLTRVIISYEIYEMSFGEFDKVYRK